MSYKRSRKSDIERSLNIWAKTKDDDVLNSLLQRAVEELGEVDFRGLQYDGVDYLYKAREIDIQDHKGS